MESEYTLPGIIHYLQSEAARYERDRNYWELERAEMKARIAKLEGEKKGNERVKEWQLKRIRMLERALVEERKSNGISNSSHLFTSETTNISPAGIGTNTNTSTTNTNATDSSYLELIKASQQTLRDSTGRTKSRTFLEKCLTEITYLVNSHPNISANRYVPPPSESSPGPDELDIFRQSFGPPRTQQMEGLNGSSISILQKSSYIPERLSDTNAFSGLEDEDDGVERIQHTYDLNGRPIPNTISNNQALTDTHWDFDEPDDKVAYAPPGHNVCLFFVRTTLRGHLDSIAAMDVVYIPYDQSTASILKPYGGVDGILLIASAGVDATIKLFVFNPTLSRSPYSASPDAIATLRGHKGTITTCVLSKNGQYLYSAGEDQVIRKWTIDLTRDRYASFDGFQVPELVVDAHAGIIWDLCISGFSDDTMVSSSADGTIKIWQLNSGSDAGPAPPPNAAVSGPGPGPGTELGPSMTCVKTITLAEGVGATCSIWIDEEKLAIACTDGTIQIHNSTTGLHLSQLDVSLSSIVDSASSPSASASPLPSATKLPSPSTSASSPELSTISAVSDPESKAVKWTKESPHPDTINAMSLIHPTSLVCGSQSQNLITINPHTTPPSLQGTILAHLEPITALAASPDGSVISSVSHDASLRFWEIERGVCIQELPAHRKKGDMGATAVKWIQCRPTQWTDGSDGGGGGDMTPNMNSASLPVALGSPAPASKAATATTGKDGGGSVDDKIREKGDRGTGYKGGRSGKELVVSAGGDGVIRIYERDQ